MQLSSRPFTSSWLAPKPQTNTKNVIHKQSRFVVRANLLDKLTKTKSEDDMPGFRYDGSMQRWVRDDRMKGKAKAEDVVIQPMSGGPYTVWPVMHQYLTDKKLKSVDADQALALMKKGAVLIDVRLAKSYESQHAQGSISVPMFRLTAGDETWDKIKRFVMASLAMDATERVPDFAGDVEKALGRNKRKKVILLCDIGGTLDTVVRVASSGKKNENDPDRAFGRESRSLKACYELLKAGFTDVVHLQGGLSTWRYDGYPVE